MPARVLVHTALGTAALALLAAALLVLAPASVAAPAWDNLAATLQTSQFEALAADGVPWYFCH
ncbi:MAG TPA: hypothetical protein VII06_21570 [Chloroflexota bacterium]|jgi:hypothetical protein